MRLPARPEGLPVGGVVGDGEQRDARDEEGERPAAEEGVAPAAGGRGDLLGWIGWSVVVG